MSTGEPKVSGDEAQKATLPNAKHKKRWTIWRVVAWLFMSVLLIVLIAAAYVWQNRYGFLEDALKDVLAEQGLDAELSIRRIGKTGATLGDIDLTAEGEPVFSAKTLKVDYDWRDALKGRMKRIELTGAALNITVDKTGKIIDGWIPASGEDSEIALPPQGLHLNDSRISASSPYGDVSARGDVTLRSLEDITADFKVEPSVFTFGTLEVKGGGAIEAHIRPGENAVKAALDFTDMVHPLGSLSYASVNGDVIFNYVDGQSQITGPLDLSFVELKSGALSAQNGKIDWDGSFSVRPDSAVIRAADGRWTMDIGKAELLTQARRAELANALTLNEAMSAAPVTTHFADSLTASVRALLTGADIEGAGQFYRAGEQVKVLLDTPLRVKAAKSQAVISPSGEAPFYDYNRKTEAIELAANVALSGARPVSLKDMKISASSPNGISVRDVTAFSANAILPSEWRAASPEGPVRLAPLSAKAKYLNQSARREMRVSLPVDYDGPLPGGYAQGLKTQGELFINLAGGGLETSFSPIGGAAITADEFQTSAGWTAKNAQFSLAFDAPFYVRGANDTAMLSTRLEALTAKLVEAETGRALALNLGGVDVSADITSAQQDWTLEMSGTDITTDDFVGAGTEVGAKSAVLKAILATDMSPQIDLRTSAARVKTDQISTDNMPIVLVGTPTDFHLDFGGESYSSAGQVAFIGNALPALPLRGGLNYVDGKIDGKALTVLPKGEDVDIDIKFAMQDGAGTAVVDIPELTFTPKGLQPQNLVPTLQGKIADVSGTVAARIDMAFASDKPLQSYGSVKIEDLNFGTLPGPFTGVNTALELTSVFPLKTEGLQTLYVESFNPGVALNDGVIKYELEDKGVRIDSAVWPLAGGELSLDPTLWLFDAPENRVTVRIDGISIGALLEKSGGNLLATGDVVGTIPVVVKGVNVSIDKGELSVKDGGVIQYRSQDLKSVVDLIPHEYVTLDDYRQFQEVRKNEELGENVGKDLAFTALRNFEYKSLSAKLDGPLDGEVEVNLQFEGRNPKILAGTAFEFNINVIGELVNLIRGLKIDGDMERLKGYLDMGRGEADAQSAPETDADPEIANPLDIQGYSSQIQLTKDINP